MRLIKKPVLCNYYVTYRCNAKCGFCDIWERPSPYITLENAQQNLKDLQRLGVKVIDFTGGEPLLHRQLPELLTLAKDLGFITTVTTNTLLYPKLAAQLAGKIDMLHFSLDAIEPEKHNESRVVACYDHLLQSIEIAKSLGEKPDILFTVNNENVSEIEEVYSFFVQKKGLHLILNPIFEYNSVGSQIAMPTIENLQKWASISGVYLNESFLDLRKAGGNSIQNPICRAASTTIVISPENELVLPCYHLGLQNFPIQNRLFELWKSNEVQALVKEEGRLPGCEGCVVNCYMEPSMAVETGQYFWKSTKSTLKYALEKWVY